MTVGAYELKLARRAQLTGRGATRISLLAILAALVMFSVLFILAEVSPLAAYAEIARYAFFNRFGLPLTISRFVFLLLCTYAFIIPYRAGLWNIGMTGQMYMGSLAAFGVALALGAKTGTVTVSPALATTLLVLAAMAGGMAYAAVAGFLRGWFNVNEIVVTMIMNFSAFWLVSFMIKEGGPFTGGGGEGEGFPLPSAMTGPLVAGVPYTLFVALALAAVLSVLLRKTRLGYEIRAFGKNPAAARYAGISPSRIAMIVFLIGGALAGLAGYHYFAAVPGVYRIPKNYGYFGDLAFYGIICGLISLGDPLAAIPVSFLFGGLSIGGRFVQGKFHMNFGVDYALLGVLMIVLVGFQFFYRYEITWRKKE